MATKAAAQPQVMVALASFVGAVNGTDISVRAGDLFGADDPIITNWPELFGPAKLRTTGKARPVVEQATAAPGESR